MSPSSDATRPTLLILEFSLTALAVVISFGWPGIGQNFFRRMERRFGKLARRKWLAVISVGLSVLLLRLVILPLFPVPLPFCSDDFSFLLAGDTFAHGRLTNPTPAMWTHFESIHITMQPTYQSMYFPGQGLLLAAGTIIFGNSWIGLLLVSALMCAALCWMLQAWLPANWALLGGMIAVLRLGVFSYWTNTYHAGGSLAALGGALILGAMPRLMRTAKLRYAMLMGIGVAILVLTRPYEGVLLCLPVAIALGKWIWKGKNRASLAGRSLAAPSVAALARLAAATLAFAIAAVAWMGYYDFRAFGNPLTPPYTIDRNTYAIAPYYVWQQPRPEPKYRYAEMRAFYHEGELKFYNHIHSVKGFVPYTLEKVGFVFLFYAGFALFPPLIMTRRVFLDRRIRFLVVCVLVLAGGMVIEIYLLPHYVAPFTAAFYAIGLQAMRHMRFCRPEGRPMGLALLRLTVVVCVLMAGIRVIASPLHFGPNEFPPSDWNESWFGPGHFGTERAQIEARLSQLAGGQLAIVRYGSDHNPEDEWVYNRADIDGSKVVWARDADAADNLELIRYYQNRTVWLVEPDLTPARVSPYAIPERASHPTP